MGEENGGTGGVNGRGRDAGSPARPAGWDRDADGDLRPRRLGRAAADVRRRRRTRDLDHPRPGGGVDACRLGARLPRAGARAGRLRGRGRRVIPFPPLLDRLIYTPARTTTVALIVDKLRHAPAPSPARALAAARKTVWEGPR